MRKLKKYYFDFLCKCGHKKSLKKRLKDKIQEIKLHRLLIPYGYTKLHDDIWYKYQGDHKSTVYLRDIVCVYLRSGVSYKSQYGRWYGTNKRPLNEVLGIVDKEINK